MEPGVEARKDTLKFADCPGGRTRGRRGPLKLKPTPLTEAPEIVAFDVPLLVTVRGCVLLVPTAILPNARLPGADNCRCLWAADEEAQETHKTKSAASAADVPLEIGQVEAW